MKTQRRRRKEHKTDYHRRVELLKSERARLVVRKTNKYLLVQYVLSKEAQDTIVFGLSSKVLLTHGWPKEAAGSLTSLPSAYLLGLLVGKTIKNKKLATPIMDFGLRRVLGGTALQAVIKGVVDSDVAIPSQKKAFPPEERLKGTHLRTKIPFDTIKSTIQKL